MKNKTISKIKSLIYLMEQNRASKWDFHLEYTFDCIVTENGINEHEEEPQFTETYTGGDIWELVSDIKEDLELKSN